MISDTKARKAKPRDKTYRLSDANGLALEVRPSGSKFWRYRYRLFGKANMFTIGEYPGVGIAQARTKLEWARSVVAEGKHPREVEKAAQEQRRAGTIAALAEEWVEAKGSEWTDYYRKQVMRGIEWDIVPVIGHRPIREVTSAEVLEVIKRVERRGAKTVALLIRQWLGAMYSHAITTLQADTDPTAPLRGVVKRGQVKHKPALSVRDLQKLVKTIWPSEGTIAYRVNEICIQLLAMTMLRTGEVRQSTWDQVAGDTWHFPAGVMKRRLPHVVPLSSQAQALIEELRGMTGTRKLMFPNMRDPSRPISNTTINRILERHGYSNQFSGHAFRTTASTILNSYGWDADWIERQLAHQPSNRVRASYNHAQYLPQRRLMLQWWADLIESLRLHDDLVIPPLPSAVQSTYPGHHSASAFPTATDGL